MMRDILTEADRLQEVLLDGGARGNNRGDRGGRRGRR
jgi:hypothetical protein